MANKIVEEIVEKAKSGDKTAFDLLYREYSEKLLKYVVKLGVDSYDAEDIVSDSFMEAIEHICDLKNNAFFSTWLHSIAKHKVFTIKEKEKKHTRVDYTTSDGEEQNDGLDIAMAEFAEYHGDTVMLPEDYVSNEEIKQILADTINSLNPNQRDAIFLFYYKNCSVGEIAQQTGVNENTVKSRLSLARKYMGKKLKELQKSGVVLCSVPISRVIGQLENEAKISVGGAPAVASAASGKAIAAAVTAIVVGTTGAMFYFNKDNGQIQGDERLPDSFVIESIDENNETDTPIVSTDEEERFDRLPVGDPTSSYTVYNLMTDYSNTVDITHKDWQLIESFAEQNFTEDMTNYQKAVVAYDYIVSQTEYGSDNSYSVYSPITRVLEYHMAQTDDFNECFASIMRYLGYEANVYAARRNMSSDMVINTCWCQVDAGDKSYVFDPLYDQYSTETHYMFCVELGVNEVTKSYILNEKESLFSFLDSCNSVEEDESEDAEPDESKYMKYYPIINEPLKTDQYIEAAVEWELIDRFAKEYFTDDMTIYQKALTAYEYIITETQLTDEITQADGSSNPVSQVLEKHKGNSFELSACMASFLRYLGLNSKVIFGDVEMPNEEINTHYCCFVTKSDSGSNIVFDPFLEKETGRSDNKYFCYDYAYREEDTENTQYTCITQYEVPGMFDPEYSEDK